MFVICLTNIKLLVTKLQLNRNAKLVMTADNANVNKSTNKKKKSQKCCEIPQKLSNNES